MVSLVLKSYSNRQAEPRQPRCFAYVCRVDACRVDRVDACRTEQAPCRCNGWFVKDWTQKQNWNGRKINSKFCRTSVEIRSKFGPNSVKNRSKIGPKSIKHRPNWLSEDPLEHLGRILGPKVAPRSIFGRFWKLCWGHVGVIFRSKSDHFFITFFWSIFDRFWIDFGALLAPIFGYFDVISAYLF